MTATPAVTVTVTGAAGQIAYSLLPRIAAGDLLGPGVRVRLRLLEVPAAVRAAEGVALELLDGASPLLADVEVTDDLVRAVAGTSFALLVGSRPRTAGMERADLLEANGAIFTAQGRALAEHAAADLRVLVVGNPANTNALVAQRNAPGVPADRFTAMTRLDHNRAVAQLARRAGVPVSDVDRVTVWGNHSPTQYPDVTRATVGGRPALEVLGDREWVEEALVPTVQQRGAEIIAARGSSSAASAAGAALDHVRTWTTGTPEGSWTSMAVVSDGSYDVPPGLVCSFPVRTSGGSWTIVPGLEPDERALPRVRASVAELQAERDAVEALGLLPR